ncbi:MAG: non-canonical purine NTP pyrophosphatase [Treponemataceae bacterium]|nr:non-canonical purine NTP pyrophosphatase [Treponemataceae bacterium]
MKIFAATGNLHKKKELSELFSPDEICIPSDLGLDFDPEENGNSFIANSLIKAEALWRITKTPVIADDSGICVDILDGRPGIYSARYSGKNKLPGSEEYTQKEKNTLLLEEAWEAASRKGLGKDAVLTCRFVCAMVLYLGKDRFISVQETIEGQLVRNIDEANGKGGFGYDPIVYLPEFHKTIAELTEEEKNKISHRGKAAKKIKTILEKSLSFS